ncbi:MAG: asparagine synthase (glutamine-hydrolyzing) [Vicinamibacteria bacterium]|nr:asparagine synthase (glutamine-hydrolyzing) [Vicinamibacteria bacterium]
MCGIAGAAGRIPGALAPLAAMTAAQRHRGPDDEGYLLADSATGRAFAFSGADTAAGVDLPRLPEAIDPGFDVALGHRRLAIIDLSAAGHCPMSAADGGLWITYNGEIYNYVELRQELAEKGHRFTGGSDTEVLLAAWREWGEACLTRFNGMWGFALYDARRRLLFCARDRFGVKPLHYSWDGALFAFASEIKGLLAHPLVPRKPHEPTLRAFLAEGVVDESDQTFFDGIRSLPAGHCATLDLDAMRLSVRAWYSPPAETDRDLSTGEFAALCEDAVRLRLLRSDVEVGTCLSGGLDSSSIVCLTARLRGAQAASHHSFSVLYADPGLVETPYVDAVVAASGVQSARATPTSAQLAADLPDLARAQDEPFPSTGLYSQWRVMRLAREAGVRVLLDGQGADEVLAGYHYHYGPFLAEIARRENPFRAMAEAWRGHRTTLRPMGFFLGLLAYHSLPLPTALRRRALALGATHGRVPETLLDPEWSAHNAAVTGQRHAPCASLRGERLANLFRTSLPALLRYEDRSSMAFSIEARTPFLDYRLVEAALALPARRLIEAGRTKAILRDAMAGVIPETVRARRDKLGFATPEQRFLAEIGPLVRKWIGPGSRVETRLNHAALGRWLAGDDRELAARPGLFRLVSAELWLRRVAEA